MFPQKINESYLTQKLYNLLAQIYKIIIYAIYTNKQINILYTLHKTKININIIRTQKKIQKNNTIIIQVIC